jgi:hypothetical protein
LENVEGVVSMAVKGSVDGSDVAIAKLLDTESDQPVSERIGEFNEWYDELPENQKGWIDLGTIGLGAAVRGMNIVAKAPDVNVPSWMGGVDNTPTPDKILATPKGSRPDPSTYMTQADIDAHLSLFDDGAVRFFYTSPKRNYWP